MSTDGCRIWIISFLQAVQEENYAVIKWRGKLDAYAIGDDLDIVCEDIGRFVKKMMLVGNDFVSAGFEISLWVAQDNKQVHLDLKEQNKLLFRFDIYKGLPNYTLVSINPDFLKKSLTDSLVEVIDQTTVKLASIDCDMVFRYLEYLEYGAISPRKLQHYHWVSQKIAQLKSQFLALIQNYTDLPTIVSKEIMIDNLPTRESFLCFKQKE